MNKSFSFSGAQKMEKKKINCKGRKFTPLLPFFFLVTPCSSNLLKKTKKFHLSKKEKKTDKFQPYPHRKGDSLPVR
jgi:hypothetical protein